MTKLSTTIAKAIFDEIERHQLQRESLTLSAIEGVVERYLNSELDAKISIFPEGGLEFNALYQKLKNRKIHAECPASADGKHRWNIHPVDPAGNLVPECDRFPNSYYAAVVVCIHCGSHGDKGVES